MTLACVTMPGRGRTDDVIAQVAQQLAAEGVRLAGVVRDRPVEAGAHPCDMDLRVLVDGPVFRISQRLGPQARGCRLDGGVMETIAALVEARVPGAQLLIVNKFGKQEMLGRGLCPAISLAVEAGIPTLVGVNQVNAPDFMAFAGGLAEPLSPDPQSVCAWFENLPAPRVIAAT